MAILFKRQPLEKEYIRQIPDRIIKVFETFNRAGFDIWLVGAGVRNLLSGREITEPDFTTNAKPEEIQALFDDTFYDNKFGTVGIPVEITNDKLQMTNGKKRVEVFEITTYRTEEGYSDKRRPDKVSWGVRLEEDLERRDFTINAMVVGFEPKSKIKNLPAQAGQKSKMPEDLLLVDPFGGREDLKKKVIKAVGKAKDRFQEDALRMIRAIRIGGQFGFLVEAKTLKAIKENASLLDHVSRERVRDELIKILKSEFPADGILLLYSSGLLKHIIPEMIKMQGVKQIGHHIYDVWRHSIESLRGCPSSDPIVRLATLLHDVGKPVVAKPRDGKEITFYGHEVVGARMVKKIAERLRFSKKEIDKLYTLIRWHMFAYDSHMTDAAIRRFIKRVGTENINDMMMLRIGDRRGGGSKSTSWRLRELQKRVGEQLYEPMTVKDLKIDGHDVMKTLKIKPSPKVGKLLNQLFEEVMEDTSLNTKQYLLKRVKELA